MSEFKLLNPAKTGKDSYIGPTKDPPGLHNSSPGPLSASSGPNSDPEPTEPNPFDPYGFRAFVTEQLVLFCEKMEFPPDEQMRGRSHQALPPSTATPCEASTTICEAPAPLSMGSGSVLDQQLLPAPDMEPRHKLASKCEPPQSGEPLQPGGQQCWVNPMGCTPDPSYSLVSLGLGSWFGWFPITESGGVG